MRVGSLVVFAVMLVIGVILAGDVTCNNPMRGLSGKKHDAYLKTHANEVAAYDTKSAWAGVLCLVGFAGACVSFYAVEKMVFKKQEAEEQEIAAEKEREAQAKMRELQRIESYQLAVDAEERRLQAQRDEVTFRTVQLARLIEALNSTDLEFTAEHNFGNGTTIQISNDPQGRALLANERRKLDLEEKRIELEDKRLKNEKRRLKNEAEALRQTAQLRNNPPPGGRNASGNGGRRQGP